MSIDGARLDALTTALTEAGLAGASEDELLRQFCVGARNAGLAVTRGLLIVDTLHPTHEGRAFRWDQEGRQSAVIEYGRTNEGERAAAWRASPFYRLEQSGEAWLNLHLTPETDSQSALIKEMRLAGMTGYLILINRFAAEGIIGQLDCIYSGWATDVPGGFDAAAVAEMGRLLPVLTLAVKCVSLGRIARTLVETYLGRDAGQRVLAGRIERGVAERIDAVIWFSDLRGVTHITDSAPPHEIIPLLNDYAEAVISSIHDSGGEVLTLIGDGVLAIFRADEPARAGNEAVRAAALARQRVVALNAERAADGQPVTEMYLGLHIGEVFYGNVGSAERLDFTVVGPAVNETSRIAAMCRSVDQPVLMSAAFVKAAREARRFVSVGRYALRGVSRAQELYTLDPDAA